MTRQTTFLTEYLKRDLQNMIVEQNRTRPPRKCRICRDFCGPVPDPLPLQYSAHHFNPYQATGGHITCRDSWPSCTSPLLLSTTPQPGGIPSVLQNDTISSCCCEGLGWSVFSLIIQTHPHQQDRKPSILLCHSYLMQQNLSYPKLAE